MQGESEWPSRSRCDKSPHKPDLEFAEFGFGSKGLLGSSKTMKPGSAVCRSPKGRARPKQWRTATSRAKIRCLLLPWNRETPMRTVHVLKALLVAGVLLGASSLSGGEAVAQKRVALVIGNSNYVNVRPLANPENDASAMAALFRDAKFDVVDASNNLGGLSCGACSATSPKNRAAPTSRWCTT